jgi:outer membrane immunogenic protein
MKKFLFAGAILATFAAIQSASAADMALKAMPPPAPVYNWTGWYAGLNLGGSFGRAGDTATFAGVPFSSTSANLDGVIGGGQVGYNWQTGAWLLGLEADIQGSSERSSATSNAASTILVCGVACFLVPITGALTDTEKLRWFGTVRGRVGVLATPTWLFYVTGGLAYGGFNSNETFTFGAATSVNNFNTTRAGWTVGGGIEGSLGNNWSAKLEYLYMDFGTFNSAFVGVAPFTPIGLSTHVTDNIVRVGVNYHFGGPSASQY